MEGILRQRKLFLIVGGVIVGGGLLAGILYLVLRKRPEKKQSEGVRIVRMRPKNRPEIPEDHIPILRSVDETKADKAVETTKIDEKKNNGAVTPSNNAKEQAEGLKKVWTMRKRLEYGEEDVLSSAPTTKNVSETPNPTSTTTSPATTSTKNPVSSNSSNSKDIITNNNSNPTNPTNTNNTTNNSTKAKPGNVNNEKTSVSDKSNDDEEEEMVYGIEDPIIAQKYTPLPTLQVLTGDCTVLRSLDQDVLLVQSSSSLKEDFYLAVQLTYEFDERLYLVRKTPLPGVLVPTRKSPCGRLLFYPIPPLPTKKNNTKINTIKKKEKYDLDGIKLLNAIIRTEKYKKEKLAYRRQFLNLLSVLIAEDVRLDDQHPVRLLQHPMNNGQALLLGLVTERRKALRLEMESGEEYRGIYRVLVQLYPQGDDALFVFSYFGTNEFKCTHQPPPDRYINIK